MSDREKKIKELEAGIAEKEKEIKATTTTLQAAHEKRMSDVNRTRDEDLKKAVSDREKKIKELEVELSGNCDGFISGDVWSTLFGSGNKVPVGCPEFYVDFNVSEIKWFYDRVANLTESVRNFSQVSSESIAHDKAEAEKLIGSKSKEIEFLSEQRKTLELTHKELMSSVDDVKGVCQERLKVDSDLNAMMLQQLTDHSSTTDNVENKLREIEQSLTRLQNSRETSERIQEYKETELAPRCDQVDVEFIVDRALDLNGLNVSCPMTDPSTVTRERLSLLNFASPNSGATIVSSSPTFSRNSLIPNTHFLRLLGLNYFFHHGVGVPEDAISEDISLGHCWPMQGSRGSITIELAQSVFVDSITIDHILPLQASDIGSAPAKFRVHTSRGPSEEFVNILSGTYDIHRNMQSQNFAVISDVKQVPTKFVTLEVLSNHGKPEWTCLYRFQVHGRLLDED